MKDMRLGVVLARKLAHEIKNPLTPIQLTIDRLKNKYSN
jgi:two-component system nitrogen regulation sensor histidine kinase NtrY